MNVGHALEDALVPRPFIVSGYEVDTADTFTLGLVAGSGAPFEFEPGQFNMLYLPGQGESAISISGDPATPAELQHTIRAVGGVTRALQRLHPGDALGVRGPFGSAWPLDAARGRHLLLIAGGVGLAPLRPAVYRALARRDEFSRVTLLYGTRRPEDRLYVDELAAWRDSGRVEVEVTVDSASNDWQGNVGPVTWLLRRHDFDPKAVVAMLCGPEIMMRYAVMELEAGDVPGEAVFVSMERNMQCAVGSCGHCQLGPAFICKDGPVFNFESVRPWFEVRAL